jgi:hypothetical protein
LKFKQHRENTLLRRIKEERKNCFKLKIKKLPLNISQSINFKEHTMAATVLLEARPYRPFKSSEEYLYAMREDLAEWLNTLYPELLINVDNFMDRLDTGVALCKVRFFFNFLFSIFSHDDYDDFDMRCVIFFEGTSRSPADLLYGTVRMRRKFPRILSKKRENQT